MNTREESGCGQGAIACPAGQEVQSVVAQG